MMIKRTFSQAVFLLFFLALMVGCGSRKEPLESLVKNFAAVPEYSIILTDMKKEGTFSNSYFHKYKIVQGEKVFFTKWLRVSEKAFQTNQKFLGMTLVSKTKDGQSNTPYPPGYQYIGNSQYGHWQNDSRGNSFWAFYGQYAFFSHVFGFGNRSFYRSDYNSFRTSQAGRRPYYGAKKQYGTGGSFTKRTNPTFFERSMAKKRASKSNFSKRVNSRFGGGRSTFGGGRGGFGGFGK